MDTVVRRCCDGPLVIERMYLAMHVEGEHGRRLVSKCIFSIFVTSRKERLDYRAVVSSVAETKAGTCLSVYVVEQMRLGHRKAPRGRGP